MPEQNDALNFALNTRPPENPDIGSVAVRDSYGTGAVLQLEVIDNLRDRQKFPEPGEAFQQEVLTSGMKALEAQGLDVKSGFTSTVAGTPYLSITAHGVTPEELETA